MPLYTPGRRRAIVLLLLTSVLLLTLDLRGNAVFDAARTGFSKVLDPLESAADVATRPIRNAWHGITDWERVSEENQQLQDQLDAVRGDQIAAQAAIQDQQALLAEQNLPTLGDYPTVIAMVVGESPSNLDQIIEINKGSNDNIEVGMPVLAGGGLIGKVTTPLLPDRARVMLLTDPRYSTPVKIVPGMPVDPTTTLPPETSVPAASAPDSAAPPTSAPADSAPATPVATPPASPPPVAADPAATTTTPAVTTTTIDLANFRDTGSLNGRGASPLPQVDFLDDTPQFGRFSIGDLVYTAGGNDSLAPPNIPIGTVRNVITRSAAEGPLLEVEPSASLDRLNFVTIVIYRSDSEVADASGQAGGG